MNLGIDERAKTAQLYKIIIEAFRQLESGDKRATLLDLELILDEDEDKSFDFEAWMRDVEAFNAELRAKYGESHFFHTQDLLDQLREEES